MQIICPSIIQPRCNIVWIIQHHLAVVLDDITRPNYFSKSAYLYILLDKQVCYKPHLCLRNWQQKETRRAPAGAESMKAASSLNRGLMQVLYVI